MLHSVSGTFVGGIEKSLPQLHCVAYMAPASDML
jgi:hypothetical protein